MRRVTLSVVVLLCLLGGVPIEAAVAVNAGSDGTSSSTPNEEGNEEKTSDASTTEEPDDPPATPETTSGKKKKKKSGGAARPIPPRKKGRQSQPSSIQVDTEQTTIRLGGAVWANFAAQSWESADDNRKRGFNFDNVRFAFDGAHGEHLLFSAQLRVYSFDYALHHAWFGLKPNAKNQIDVGVTQVPFGLMPFATHSFWFGIGYYLGFEDDYDAGVKWYRDGEAWDLHVAYFMNEEYNDATRLNRYSVDLVRQGEQQNEEQNQVNGRFAYFLGEGKKDCLLAWGSQPDCFLTQLGASGEYGKIDNVAIGETGDRWAAAVHYKARYGDWNPEVQVTRYQFNPENPSGVDDRLVLFGNLGSTRLIAAEGTLVNVNLRHFWEPDGKWLKRYNAYINYSHLFKDENEFKDSQIVNPGMLLDMGPFWIWIDLIVGKNAWYLNDSSEMSGLGAGGTDDWETRFNVNFEWYF